MSSNRQWIKKKYMIAILFWVPAIIIILCIFFFSSRNGGQSHSFSMKFATALMDKLSALTDGKINSSNLELWEIDILLRKLAHITEYTLLAAAVMIPLYFYRFRRLKLFFLCFGACFIYACIDEYHQLFINGRTGKFTDILVDCIGILIGITFSRFIKFIVRSISRRISYQGENET